MDRDHEYESWLDERDEAEHLANVEMEYLHDLDETTKLLAGGAFDRPQTLAEFIAPRFKSIYNRAATKTEREAREWRERR